MRLVANRGYWDRRRGPRLQEVVFRNDLGAQEALEAVCTTECEVDIVTEIPPDQAQRVEHSEHGHLVSVDAVHVIAGVVDRDASDVPLHDRRARQALNLAVDRGALVREAMHGRARPLAGLTPPTALTTVHRFPRRLRAHPHDPALAARLWAAAGGVAGQTLRIAALEGLEAVAHRVADDVVAALGLHAEVRGLKGEEAADARRALAEKDRPRPWHVLIVQQGVQSADAPPLELHRAFAGRTGEYRAGPVIPAFEELYAELPRHTSPAGLVAQANAIDRFVREQSLALFLCAPDALYAVNRHVRFKPYATTLELAETEVGDGHWSVR